MQRKSREATATPAANPRTLAEYYRAMEAVDGWFSLDGAILFLAYNQVIAAEGIRGDAVEIGVYRGRSALVAASLCGPGRRFLAVDLFETGQHFSGTTPQSREAFMATMSGLYPSTDFVRPLAAWSAEVTLSTLGTECSFCHIDAGHSAEETYHDLDLCARALMPGGLLALDDYFNPSTPGVCEGAVEFMLSHREVLKPLAIGANKVLFQKRPVEFDANERFVEMFPFIPRNTTTLWGAPVHLFDFGLAPFVDIGRSTSARLVPGSELVIAAQIDSDVSSIRAKPGEVVSVPMRVTNASSIDFHWGIFLSYHLLGQDGALVRWDNVRSAFSPPLLPGAERRVNLAATAPDRVGSYRMDIDIVWEGVTWFGARGNPTRSVLLDVA